MDNQNQTSGPVGSIAVSSEEIHTFRKEIDAVIQKSQALQGQIGRNAGGREISLVVTKLQEGKMWTGKILEAMGQPFPANLADKADKPTA